MSATLAGRRVLITGAARGIGSLTAKRLHESGARVALLGIESELLEQVAADCGDAPWFDCDVTDREAVLEAVAGAVEALGGLDVAVANAGVGAQLPLVGGDPEIWDQTLAVNLAGTYNLVHAAGPHISHPNGYFLLTSSLAAVVHGPLMSPYSASKAAVEALGNSLRIELAPSGARAGVAYFAELDTDMTTRAFDTKASKGMPIGLRVSPVEPAIEAVVKGIANRSRHVVYPPWGRLVLWVRPVVPRVVELALRRRVAKALELAREEHAELTTPQR